MRLFRAVSRRRVRCLSMKWHGHRRGRETSSGEWMVRCPVAPLNWQPVSLSILCKLNHRSSRINLLGGNVWSWQDSKNQVMCFPMVWKTTILGCIFMNLEGGEATRRSRLTWNVLKRWVCQVGARAESSEWTRCGVIYSLPTFSSMPEVQQECSAWRRSHMQGGGIRITETS